MIPNTVEHLQNVIIIAFSRLPRKCNTISFVTPKNVRLIFLGPMSKM